ncbi:MAG: DMT family transporter, partial [Pseudomonadota bacterium]
MTPQKTMTGRAWAEMILLAAIWGASFLAIRVALDEVAPLTSVAHRTGWAMLALWAVVAAMRLPLPRDARVWFGFLGMGLLNNVIPFGLMAWGQLHVETGLTSILNGATAIFGVLMAALFFADERITIRKALGVTLGFFGVAMAIGLDNFRSFDLQSLAQLAILGGTVSYALASVLTRSASRRQRLAGQDRSESGAPTHWPGRRTRC